MRRLQACVLMIGLTAGFAVGPGRRALAAVTVPSQLLPFRGHLEKDGLSNPQMAQIRELLKQEQK